MNHTEEIKLIAQLGTDAAQVALAEYTRYYVLSSIVWGTFCLLAIAGSAWLWRYVGNNTKPERDEMECMLIRTLIALAVLVFALCFFNNVSDLINPKAMAIHQLLKDLRAK